MVARAGEPSPLCKACAHPERVRIELLLAGGAGQRPLARKFGLTHHALGRHWRAHVSEERKASMVLGPVQRMNLAAQLSEESASVIDHFRVTRAGLYKLFDAALEAGDRTGGAMVAGRLIACLDSIARITGELASSPLVQNNTQVTNVYMLPEVSALMADVIRALSRFPEARAAVLQEFEKREAAVPTSPRAALEHHHAAA
jgi:hypothetical protein